MLKKSSIKLAVSVYSFTNEYYTRKYSLEDCIQKVSEIGADGIEIVSTQHIPGYPNPDDEFIAHFNYLLDKYELEPACYSLYIDLGRNSKKDMTKSEIIESFENDLSIASKMRFSCVRTLPSTPLYVIPDLAAMAERHKIKLGIELHAPYTIHHPLFQKIIEKIKEIDSPYLGLIPDFGAWVERIPTILLQNFRERGVPDETVELLRDSYAKGESFEVVKQKILSIGVGSNAQWAIGMCYHILSNGKPGDVKEIMPYVIHVHAKFWDVDREGVDGGIDYDKLLPIIAESGYTGYLSSEFEGFILAKDYNGFEMVKSQHENMHKILDNLNGGKL